MQWLAGHAQLAWYSLIFAGGWLLYRTIALGGRAALPKRLAQFGVAGALALLVAGAQLAPTLEYLGESARSSGLDPEFAMTYSFWPWRLTGLIAPDLFGHPRAGSYWGYGNYWEDALYLGVLPALLAVGALLRRDGAPLRWYLAGTAGLALLLALGKNTPLFPFLYERVPTFGLFQAPTRWNLLLVFAMALLAGFGAERWGEAVGRKLYWLRLGTAGAGAVVVTAAIGAQVVGEVEPTFIPAVALAGALLLACGVLGLTRGGRPTLIWQAFAVGLVLADLLYAARGNNPTLPLVAFEPRPAGEIAAYRAQRLYMPRAVEQDLKFEQAFRFDDFQADQDWSFVRAKALPNTGLLDGLSSANNFDPILSARYAEWIERLESAPPALQSELYRMMGVGWVADSGGEYQPVADGRRAWVVPTAEWVSGRLAALAAVFDESFEPSERVVLERPPGMPPDGAQGSVGQPQGAAGQDSADQAQIVGQSAGRTAIQVETVQGGWLMLADSWYPGWQAYLDGTPVDSYPANGIFRAVWAPEGAHTVAFRYQPSSFRLGLSMTVLGLIGLAIALRRR